MLGAGKSTVEIIIAAKDRTKAAFAKVNTQMKTMKGGTGRLTGAMTGLKGGLSSATSSLGSFGTALGPVGIAVAGTAVVMVTLGGAAIKAALDFEKATATIRVGTGATGEALAGLEGSFQTVFTAVPTSTANAATAIADLNTRLGLTGEPLEALSTQFLNLSRITGTDVAASISSATRVMHDFAVSSEEQAGTLDYLFKVSQSTGLGMTQLGNSMTQYGSVMRQMGFDINESAALLGKFEKEGVNLQLVLGSLRMGLANFAKAGEEPVEALSRVIEEIQGMGSVADANMKAIEIFGSRAGPDMAAAIREGRFSIEELMATLDASSETINKAAADTLTFGDKWTLAKNNIMEAIAPIGDVIINVLGNAIEGASASFNMLQAVMGPLMDIFTIFSDIFTIVAAAAKWLGEAIGSLVSMALTPLVAKLKEGMDMLGAFYDKLGPIKGALEWVGEGIHNVAESFRDTKSPIEEVGVALEELADKGAEGPKAIADAWALAIKDFQEGTGSYKEAIGGIEEKIAALTEEYMTATDKRKAAIEKEVEILNTEKDTLEELKQTAEDTLSSTAKETEEATKKMEEFKVTIGDTTIEFKGAAAEVIKNADAYEKLQDSAQTLIDLDWSVFTEFEAALPNIEAGILDMESAFVGLKDILEDNIGSLENVKESVMDISEIAAPFLEEGFLEGIESIGSFASSLKDAGSAINTFSSLQDVSVEGCANFSKHVYDMVSALEVLDSQMEDLVPAFGEMDLLIKSTTLAFTTNSAQLEENSILMTNVGRAWIDFEKHGAWGTDYVTDLTRGLLSLGYSAEESTWRAKRETETYDEFIQYLSEDLEFLSFIFQGTANSLKVQTTELKKITDALQPYLEFMRTLNELAALSTLSTAELDSGLNSINDTLINLGKSLETFDLRPVMESLFGTKITEGDIVSFTEGTAKGFTDTMAAYQGKFSMLITYVSQLSVAITSLVSSFDALENISESVLADQTKLKDLFGEIADIMVNFSKVMGEEGFATTFATAMEMMLKSASPLIDYFQKNNAAVGVFNSTLTTFTTVIKNVVDAMDLLKAMSEMTLPSVTELEAGFGKVEEALSRFTEAISTSFADVKIELVALDKEWTKHKEGVEDSLESFSAATNTITTLSSEIITLSATLKELKDMSVLSMRDIDEALKNIPLFLDDFVDALRLNMYEIKESLKDLDTEWSKHADAMKDTMPAYEDSTEQIGKLIGSLLSLNSALEQLAEMGTISGAAFDRGFSSLIKSISNFAVSLSKNVDGLIDSLQTLRRVWLENEDVLIPLMRDFAIISDNLWGVAHNTNRMAEEFKKLSETSGTLKEGFKSLIEFINQVVESTKEFYTAEAAAELATFITDVGKVIAAFVGLEKELNEAMVVIESKISSAVSNIESNLRGLSNLVKSAYYWGANIMGAFITGIYSMSDALELAVIRQAAIVDDYLGASSPTKLGPLSKLDEWPRNLIQSYSSGLEAEMHTLNSAFSPFTAGPETVTASTGNRNVNFYVTQNIGSHADADYSTDQLRRMLTRQEVM
jgi:TP901 family phage tail tape measure protein